jgi:hypothetical protein
VGGGQWALGTMAYSRPRTLNFTTAKGFATRRMAPRLPACLRVHRLGRAMQSRLSAMRELAKKERRHTSSLKKVFHERHVC